MQNNLMKMEDEFYEENEINIYDLINIFLKNIKLAITDLSRDERTKLYTKADRAKKLISLKDVEIELEIKGKNYK